ncbi:MAG: nucleotidyl transferase AbiEii/AbiGii toxin family protein [Propionibacteriaceae bacterium]|jgi:hypothetical protein|nr:nucleotidyl transferase AbiEii/AbiGii toxin family protein [Propionibacteriaceae bacterium]
MPGETPAPQTSLFKRLRTLKPKSKEPNSANVLNNWILLAERDMDGIEGGRLGWLVASTIVTAVLQRAVLADGTSQFLLKGGTMLQHRLSEPTRSTKDVDGLVRGGLDLFLTDLDKVLAEPWGPIGFRRGDIEVIDTPAKLVKPRRVQVTLTLRGVTWRKIQVELSPDEGHAGESADVFPAPALAGFGLPDPRTLVGLTMRYQIAQKLHASTDPHHPPEYVNDRARDVVDLSLLKDLVEKSGSPTPSEIRQAATDIFAARAAEARALGRNQRDWPPTLTAYPHWAADYTKAAASAHLTRPLDEAVEYLNQWIAQIDQS